MESRTAFSDSNDLSNGSSTCCLELDPCVTSINAQNHYHHSSSTGNFTSPDTSALPDSRRSFDSPITSTPCIFGSESFDGDAIIAVAAAGKEIVVHLCILASKSPYLRSKGARGSGGVRFEVKDLARDYDVGFDALVTVLAYLYSGKVKPLPKDVCVCVDEECSHLGCRPAVDFMVTFQIAELVSLYQLSFCV